MKITSLDLKLAQLESLDIFIIINTHSFHVKVSLLLLVVCQLNWANFIDKRKKKKYFLSQLKKRVTPFCFDELIRCQNDVNFDQVSLRTFSNDSWTSRIVQILRERLKPKKKNTWWSWEQQMSPVKDQGDLQDRTDQWEEERLKHPRYPRNKWEKIDQV